MEEKEIKEIKTETAPASSYIPSTEDHKHTGTDSPQIDYSHLKNKPNTLELLADVSLASAATNLETGTFEARNYLKILLYTGTRSASTNLNLRFNGDADTNYNWRVSDNAAGHSNAGSATLVGLINTTAGLTVACSSVIEIFNVTTLPKTVFAHTMELDITGSNVYDGKAFWDDGTQQVTAIKLLSDAAQTFGIGTRIIVYGTN